VDISRKSSRTNVSNRLAPHLPTPRCSSVAKLSSSGETWSVLAGGPGSGRKRDRWRRGEPLGLIEYKSPTFLDLPKGVRDQIYYTVLVSPNPISVCSMHYTWTTRSQDRRFTSIERLTLDPSCPILAPPTLAIISCSRQLAVGARAAFYSLNTFRFAGHEAWQPMYRWLNMIGEVARAHLQNLMVEVLRPKGLIQDQHGSHEFY
jgi:hypothetical protein